MKKHILPLTAALLLTFTFTSCDDEDLFGDGIPRVETVKAIDLTPHGATIVADIYGSSDFEVTARGVCLGLSSNPTTSNSYIYSGKGMGEYAITFDSSKGKKLNIGTIYFARAFAKVKTLEGIITVYGNEIQFKTPDGVAKIEQGTVSKIDATSFSFYGAVSQDGMLAITRRGFCWSTTSKPEANTSSGNNYTNCGIGIGSYSGSTKEAAFQGGKNLKSKTKYYVRAFATNEAGTVYGPELTLTTL